MKYRLQHYLALAGIASRRKCEEYIRSGIVRVNGKIITEMGMKVGPDDIVEFRSKRVHIVRKKYYFALNKPVRYVCSTSDPEGRSLAIDLLRPYIHSRLFSVGRLDYLSSGLIFFTNDGVFAKIVSHPSYQIEREYIAETKKTIREEDLQIMKKGCVVDGEFLKIKSYRISGTRKVFLILTEGKKREIRSLFSYHHYDIRRLHRIRIGPVTLKNLESGRFRELKKHEIEYFLKAGNKQ